MNKFLQYKALIGVINEGSLSGAGRALNVTPSAVAKQVNALEAALGVKLIDRSHSSTSPTAAGQAFFNKAVAVLAAMEEAEADIQERELEVSGPLTISLSKSLLHSKVDHWIFKFSQQYPAVNMNIQLSDDTADLYKEGIDFAFRLGKIGDSTRLLCQRLFSVTLRCVANQAYIERNGCPTSFADLAQHQVMIPESQSLSDQLRASLKRYSKILDGPFVQRTNDIEVVRHAVQSGSCIGFLLDTSIDAALTGGQMIDLFPNANLPKKPLHLIRKKGTQHSARIEVFRRHILDQNKRS